MEDKYTSINMLNQIKRELKLGTISYEMAKLKAQPYLDDINLRGGIIAKKHKKKATKVSFEYFMR